MDKDFLQKVTDFISSILGFEPEIEISQESEEVFINIKLDPENSGLLIGRHGEVLSALQLIVSLMYHQESHQHIPIRLNINDYRQQRQKSLESLADSVAQKCLERQSPVSIGNLSSYERRIVHSHLSNRTDVITHSEGESPNRVLIVSPL